MVSDDEDDDDHQVLTDPVSATVVQKYDTLYTYFQ